MDMNAQGRAAEPWDVAAANEDFPDVDAEPDAHVYVHCGWDPYAAWRARVKAMFSPHSQDAPELLT
jgi:hypothetical protein